MKLDAVPSGPLEPHELIFETFDALALGEVLELVSDRNFKLLSSQLQAARSRQPSWEYLKEDPEVRHVRTGRG